ncbi:uncharacterized protein CCOS01_04215 [Colletotrichum costaricense]|uniref:Uncharacterized protein n=1 Tax=Colletotrichum costaricense TaxID=1209916 RepID=A0AAJ0E2R3_9PEZI|nr:uncharacterized protein CCOS01_04215 [Colletotrichum costaricense]KAK1532232.1 hypothetical protein CCOS01_04215 [Colletotrichum costaricense]
MAEHTQGRFMVIEDSEAESPNSMPEDEPREGRIPQPTNTDTPQEQMPLSFGERLAAQPPRRHRTFRKSFFSKNLEVIRWEKKNVSRDDSMSYYQEHTFVIVGKARAALQAQRIEELTSRLRKCEEDNQELEKCLIGASDEAADMEKKLAWALERAADAEAELAQRESDHRDAMDNLEKGYHKLSGRIEKLESRLEECEVAKLKTQPLANSSKVSDELITAIWAKMQYNINYLANHVLTGCPSEGDLKDGCINDSCFLSSDGINDYIDQLQDEDMRPFVVAHYLWKTVIGRFFDLGVDGSYEKTWAGTIGMSFITCFEKLLALCNRRQLDPTKILHGKAEIGEMINQMIGVDQAEMLRVVQMEMVAFFRFVPNECPDYKAKNEKLERYILKIFDDAVQLRGIFMASRAYFYPKWYKEMAGGARIRFDDKSMEAEGWEKEPLGDGNIVLCNISPGLVKVGTADGNSYDSDLLLVKARVVCD